MDPRFHGQDELAGRGSNREEGGVEPRERALGGENTEVVEQSIQLGACHFAGAPEQRDELLVVVGLAQQVDIAAENLFDYLGSVGGGDEVPQAGKMTPCTSEGI